jgi:PRTRC genetic system protein B
MINTSIYDRDISHGQLVLRKALMIYGNQNNSGAAGFVSLHDVENTPKGPIVGVGKPASKVALRKLLRELNPRNTGEVTYLQENILSKGDQHLVWYVPPKARQVWFKNADLGGERTNTVPHPGLVFCVTPRNWYVFALKDDGRPTPDTELFYAPYMNVYGNGNICMGNVTAPRGNMRWNTDAWEEAFFRSYFTHFNDAGSRRIIYKGGGVKFWKRMLDKPMKHFPVARLVSRGITLGGFLDKLSQGEY